MKCQPRTSYRTEQDYVDGLDLLYLCSLKKELELYRNAVGMPLCDCVMKHLWNHSNGGDGSSITYYKAPLYRTIKYP